MMLGNRGIAFKLGLGFGMCILFTLIVSGVYWSGLSSIMDRTVLEDKTQDIADILGQPRLLMLRYANSFEIQDLEKVQANLTKLQEKVKTLKPLLTQAKEREALDGIQNALLAYGKTVSTFHQAVQSRDQATKGFGEDGANIFAKLQQLQKKIKKGLSEAMAANDSARAINAATLDSTANSLAKQFFSIRVEMLYFAWRGD
jgi:methyl-accepting chemotaxis protein